MKKRLLPLLLLLSLLLCACGGNTTPDTSGTSDTTTTSTTQQQELPAANIDLIKDGKPLGSLVRAEDAPQPIIDGVSNLAKRIKRVTETSISIGTDWVKRGSTPDNESFEILIGQTNREATAEMLASLPDHSYGIRFIGNKLVICGTNENMTALALYAFENTFFYNKECTSSGKLSIPADTSIVFTSEKMDTLDGIFTSSYSVQAIITNKRATGYIDEYRAAQGAATDGKYFYNILLHYEASPQVGVIVKSTLDGQRVAVSEKKLPLDHGNDMCYNSTENCLVVTNMLGKTITMIDPETLTVIKQVNATELPGTPYAIAYNKTNDCYIILAGGRYNILDRNFHLLRGYPMISHNYMGQGMDADDNFIYIPGSPYPEKGTKDNVIHVYDWYGRCLKAVKLSTAMESETMLNFDGQYYINFNSEGAKIYDLAYTIVYN